MTSEAVAVVTREAGAVEAAHRVGAVSEDVAGTVLALILVRKVASLASEAVVTVTQAVEADAVHASAHLRMAMICASGSVTHGHERRSEMERRGKGSLDLSIEKTGRRDQHAGRRERGDRVTSSIDADDDDEMTMTAGAATFGSRQLIIISSRFLVCRHVMSIHIERRDCISLSLTFLLLLS